MKRLMGEFPSVMRVDLRPSDDSSLTWSGREREERGWKEEERGGRREEREREEKRRGRQ